MPDNTLFQPDPSLFNLPKTQLPPVTAQDLSALLQSGPAIPQNVAMPQNMPQSADLATARNGLSKELQDPDVRQRLMASTMAEVGDQGANAQLAYMESVMNRAVSRGMSLDKTVTDTGYYPDSTLSRLGRTYSGSTADNLNGLISQALGGSNLSNFATGNESGNVRSGGAPIQYNPGTGERFVLENADKGWQNSLGRVAAGAGVTPAPTPVTVADLIKQHGVQSRAPVSALMGQSQGMSVADFLRQHGL